MELRLTGSKSKNVAPSNPPGAGGDLVPGVGFDTSLLLNLLTDRHTQGSSLAEGNSPFSGVGHRIQCG